MQASRADITPQNAQFILLSFEGPDRYSRAGGLAERVTELAHALAAHGFPVHLIFAGDPSLPGREEQLDGRLVLHRWCQWVSKYYPEGVYAGEEGKVYDLNDSLPHYVLHEIVQPAVADGKVLVVLAEEWHTAEALCRISDALYYGGLRHRAVLMWNANNVFSFHRVNWGRLAYASGLVTVSKYMKHLLWGWGVNPLVIPNGVPNRYFDLPDPAHVARLRRGFGDRLVLFKIGRFDPDKRWLMAVEAVARLKERGARPCFIIRGGIEPHGSEVHAHAASRALRIQEVSLPDHSVGDEIDAVLAAADADVINIRSFVSEAFKRTCYAAADVTLANSGREPFGMVGLESMASGGVAFVGATGEDYAISFENSIVLETDDPEEIVGYVQFLCDHPSIVERVREAARETARRFTWEEVIENLMGRLRYLSAAQGVH